MTAIHFTPEQRSATTTFLYEVGQRLQTERAARRYSQRRVEIETGIDDNHVGRIEQGVLANVCVATVLKLLRLYGLTLAIVPAAPPSEER